MPVDHPRIGVLCTTRPGPDLDFALRSIALNTTWPDFRVLVGADPGPDGSEDHRPALDRHKAEHPWFDYVWCADRPADRRGLGSASDMLADLHARLLAEGCTRFFFINDDIAVTRHWLHYAEDALTSAFEDGAGVVIPHDGIASTSSESVFAGFYYFSQEYVERFCPGGIPWLPEPVRCYWLDCEFLVRAAKAGRLVREPKCCVLHLHHNHLPSRLRRPGGKRAVNASSVRDCAHFVDRMRTEGVDPWRHIPGFARYAFPAVREQLESLRGLEDTIPADPVTPGASPCR